MYNYALLYMKWSLVIFKLTFYYIVMYSSSYSRADDTKPRLEEIYDISSMIVLLTVECQVKIEPSFYFIKSCYLKTPLKGYLQTAELTILDH